MPAISQTNAWSVASLQAASQAAGKAGSQPLFGAASDWDFSFHNLLGVINPLQHLPVIGTLYRALTGDTIGAPEKIAGDTLYGGLWGAVSSIADTAFEAATGKDFGDTVLALFQSPDSSTKAIAANDVAPTTVSAPTLVLRKHPISPPSPAPCSKRASTAIPPSGR